MNITQRQGSARLEATAVAKALLASLREMITKCR